jgi:hypothetical protein
MIPFRQVTIPTFLPVILGMLLMSACAPTERSQESATALQQAAVTTSWSAILNISGGFAGLMQTLTLDQSGQAIFIDKRKKSRTAKQITREDLQIYADLVKNLADTNRANSRPDQCRDCINYALEISSDGKLKHREVNTISLTNSDAKELISKLASLAAEMRANK